MAIVQAKTINFGFFGRVHNVACELGLICVKPWS